jgi:hypothetical protein
MQVVATEDSKHVFSYLYPGCVVYQARRVSQIYREYRYSVPHRSIYRTDL